MGASFADTIVGQTMNLDLTKSRIGAEHRPLESLCTDLFLIVIRMREAEDLGAPAALVKLIKYYLDLFEKNCAVIGLSSGQIASAKYALVALLDETVLSIPGMCRDHWVSSPLQLEYFGDNIAGEEYFRKLDKLLVEPDKMQEILQVYYLCLSLGFEGKYRISDSSQRDQIIDNLGRTIKRSNKVRFSKLSPHGIRTQPGRMSIRQSQVVPLWIISAFCAAVILIVWTAAHVVTTAKASEVISALR